MFYFLKSVLWMIGLIFPFSSCLRTTKHNNNRDSLNTASGQAATHQPKQLSTVSTQIGVEEQEIDDIISRSTISSIQMKSDHEEGGEKNGKRMQTNAKANILLEPLEGEIALGTIKFNFKNILKGEPGVSGPKGPRGRQGMMGKRGQRGEKGEPGVLNTNNGPMAIRFRHVKEECTSECSGTVRLNENGDALELCASDQWSVLYAPIQRDVLGPVSYHEITAPKSCLDARLRSAGYDNGMYWINAKPGTNEFSSRVYCDMTTSGGGWTLVAKVTHNFAWVCPEQNGNACTSSSSSSIDPRQSNLFHNVHERDVVDFVEEYGRESGTHLRNSLIREIFMSGRRQIRFTFISGNGWEASDDAYASFRHTDDTSSLFADDTWEMYSRTNGDFSWNIIKHQRAEKSFSGDIICWGNTDDINYRYYEGGLHMGLPAEDGKPCHLLQDTEAIMLKSHYATMGSGQPTWATNQCGLLGSEMFGVISSKVAIWVR